MDYRRIKNIVALVNNCPLTDIGREGRHLEDKTEDVVDVDRFRC